MPNKHRNPTAQERDERVSLPLDAETALRALLKVDPEADAEETNEDDVGPG